MSLADDFVTAGVGAAAALIGAVIGARATRSASLEVFNKATESERQAWRLALHQECLQNIDLSVSLPDNGQWIPETRVLRECPSHAAAFTPTVLQHVRWATTACEELDAALLPLRAWQGQPGLNSVIGPVKEARSRAIGEISLIEQELRRFVPVPD